MRHSRRFAGCSVLLAVWLLPALAMAQLVIDVDPSKFRQYPIAATALKNFGDAPDADNVAALGQSVLMSDFAVAGLFEVLDPKSFLEDPKTSGITEATVNFTQWLQVGAEGLVKGGFWIMGDKVKLDLRLFDVAQGKEMLARTYEDDARHVRAMLHAFADEIVKFFTKEDGIFSTKIAAIRKAGKGKQAVVMDFDGHGQYVLVDNANINLLPAWSPEGGGVYFTSYMNGNPDLYRVGASPGDKIVKVSVFRGLNVGASVSRANGKVALTLSKDGNSEIYAMNADGTGVQRITNSWGIDASPSWAPDGATLAFVSDRSGSPQIYVQPTAGGTALRLTFQGNYNQSPAWSPKGDKIAFCGRDERLVFDLFLVDVGSKEITRLTQDQGNNEDPAWSPDGRHIVFSSTRTGTSQLFIMNADGANQRQITDGKGDYQTPDWSPRLKRGK